MCQCLYVSLLFTLASRSQMRLCSYAFSVELYKSFAAPTATDALDAYKHMRTIQLNSVFNIITRISLSSSNEWEEEKYQNELIKVEVQTNDTDINENRRKLVEACSLTRIFNMCLAKRKRCRSIKWMKFMSVYLKCFSSFFFLQSHWMITTTIVQNEYANISVFLLVTWTR